MHQTIDRHDNIRQLLKSYNKKEGYFKIWIGALPIVPQKFNVVNKAF